MARSLSYLSRARCELYNSEESIEMFTDMDRRYTAFYSMSTTSILQTYFYYIIRQWNQRILSILLILHS